MKSLRKVLSSVCFWLLSFCVFSQMEMIAKGYEAIEIEIPVSCFHVALDETHIYQVVIEPENDSSPLPELDTLEIPNNGIGKFQIEIDEPGTFTYEIYEDAGTDKNIQYDDTVYHVTVYVEVLQDDALGYAISVTGNRSRQKSKQLEFQDVVLGEEIFETTTVAESSVTKHQTEQTTEINDSSINREVETSIAVDLSEIISSDVPDIPSENSDMLSENFDTLPENSDEISETEDSTTTTTAIIRPHRQLPNKPSVEEKFNPFTGDTTPMKGLSVFLTLGAVGMLLSFKKQARKGGQNHEGKKQK